MNADSPRSPPHPLFAVFGDIKLSHTIFAMPFALAGALVATAHQGRSFPNAWELTLVLACMVFARSFAMGVNRFADAKLDAKNPRTQGRAVPSGLVSRAFMAGFSISCAILFLAACAGFWFFCRNPWPIRLGVPILGLLALYSYTKRFTWACHLVLGISLAISPGAAALALDPAALRHPEPWLLAAMVTCWVSGFDILYALQDVQVDRASGLYSMPARLGTRTALWISRSLHAMAALLLLALAPVSTILGPVTLGAAVVAVALLLLEHILVSRDADRHLPMAFFTLNGIISVILGAAIVFEAWRHAH